MKSKLSFGVLLVVVLASFAYKNHVSNKKSDIALINIEALSDGEITVVGCKQQKGSTCYVFSGENLVDKRKNQYPG